MEKEACCKLAEKFKLVYGSGRNRVILSGRTAKDVLKSALRRNNKPHSNNTKGSGYLRTRKVT